MKLQETDWDAPGGAATVERDYPNAPIADFVNWIRKTSAWRENPELVERRVRKLERELSEIRNAPRPASRKIA